MIRVSPNSLGFAAKAVCHDIRDRACPLGDSCGLTMHNEVWPVVCDQTLNTGCMTCCKCVRYAKDHPMRFCVKEPEALLDLRYTLQADGSCGTIPDRA